MKRLVIRFQPPSALWVSSPPCARRSNSRLGELLIEVSDHVEEEAAFIPLGGALFTLSKRASNHAASSER